MTKRLTSFLLVPLVLALLSPYRLAASPSPPVPIQFPLRFGPGEQLSYEVSLDDTHVGKAVFEVTEKTRMAGREVYHVISKIRSNKWISLFSRIDDQVESYIDAEAGYSHRIKINKRRRKGDEEKTIDFDQVGHHAIEWKDNKQEVFDIPPKVQDFLSSLYFLRAQERLEPGTSVFIDLHQNGKNWQLEVHVLEKERISTPAGTFKTIKVQTSFPDGGLFKSKGDLAIWLTDDDLRVPVRLRSEGKKGTMTAILSSQKEGEVNFASDGF
ncbi:MAG TPA: DUF3108 domain-containing protein [Candidatus Manganitrophaceae bacterium]|nr:DUF3108 domain-containing protein [Candidatus Manganitrophaceae bacterium]